MLVEFLEEDYEEQKDLVLIGVNGIWSVFEMQGPTPKNDFCRIFSRNSVLQPLSLVLSHVLDEEGELAELCVERVVNIFYLFSQAENHVKEMVADRMVLRRKISECRIDLHITNKFRCLDRLGKDAPCTPSDYAEIHKEPVDVVIYPRAITKLECN